MNEPTSRDPRQYSLAELAAAAGMTVRNVRSYQTRGLIPPPTRQARRSVYNAVHLDRLQEIRQARSRGATLGLISTHLSRGGELVTEGIDNTWLPVENETAKTKTSRPDRASSLDNLVRRASSDPEVLKAVDSLVSRGLIRRAGSRLVADRPLAQSLNTAVRRGVPVLPALQLMEAAADAGVIINRAVDVAMAAVPASAGTTRNKDKARNELFVLAGAILSRRSVVIDLPAAERAASLASG